MYDQISLIMLEVLMWVAYIVLVVSGAVLTYGVIKEPQLIYILLDVYLWLMIGIATYCIIADIKEG